MNRRLNRICPCCLNHIAICAASYTRIGDEIPAKKKESAQGGRVIIEQAMVDVQL
jgi:hypothetical protein